MFHPSLLVLLASRSIAKQSEQAPIPTGSQGIPPRRPGRVAWTSDMRAVAASSRWWIRTPGAIKALSAHRRRCSECRSAGRVLCPRVRRFHVKPSYLFPCHHSMRLLWSGRFNTSQVFGSSFFPDGHGPQKTTGCTCMLNAGSRKVSHQGFTPWHSEQFMRPWGKS